jgi:SulP family sulfate permease
MVRTLIAQLVYTLGGSGFAGANGSMMIEVVVCVLVAFLPFPLLPNLIRRSIRQPFFHILATAIAQEIGDENPAAIVATTLVAYAMSSVLTGVYLT